MYKIWNDFVKGAWCDKIDVEDFIKLNYKEYTGNDNFLVGISDKTKNVWNKCEKLLKEELKNKVLDIDTEHFSSISGYDAGFIDKDNEVIVGLQTDAPLKRIVNPYGGFRMVRQELEAYNYELNKDLDKYFNMFRKTHNQGEFDAYTKEIRAADVYKIPSAFFIFKLD